MILRVSYILLLRWFAGFFSIRKKILRVAGELVVENLENCRNYILGGPSQLLSG